MKNNSEKKLAIIGISWDRNFEDLKEITEKYKMNWINIDDKNAEIIHLYGIHSIPQLILVNKEGVIVYTSETGNGRRELLKILKDI